MFAGSSLFRLSWYLVLNLSLKRANLTVNHVLIMNLITNIPHRKGIFQDIPLGNNQRYQNRTFFEANSLQTESMNHLMA